MSTSGRFQVVLHNDRPLSPTGILLDAGALAREERWDGEACLVLNPPGKPAVEGTTMQQELDRIRNNPRLTLMSSSIVRRVEDTEALWQAWRGAMLDTLGSLNETELARTYHNATNLDDHSERIAIRDLRRRLQTAIRTWREHLAFLRRERETVAASVAPHETQERSSREKFETQVAELEQMVTAARCVATARVLRGAAHALQGTMEERRELRCDRSRLDRTEYLEVLRAMSGALSLFTAKFKQDLAELRRDATAATATIERSIAQKKESYKAVCQALSKQYHSKVHEPLRLILKHFSGKEGVGNLGSLEFAAGVLDDANDPYCVKRCEVALSELDRICDRLGKLAKQEPRETRPSIWDDEVLNTQREKRAEQAAAADAGAMSAADALREERKVLVHAFLRAKAHLQKLQSHAAIIEARIVPQMFDESGSNRQVATLARVVSQRQENLREEIAQTDSRVRALHKEIVAAAERIPVSTRHAEAARLRSTAQAVHSVCMRMRAHFLDMVRSEEGIRQVVHDQFNESARTIFHQSRLVVHRAIQSGQARCAAVDAQVGRAEDAVKEATRRIDVLNRCRIDQESGMTGFEIAVFTALEQWVAANSDVHRVYDTLARVDSLIETCTSALQLLQETLGQTQSPEGHWETGSAAPHQ